MINRLFKFFYKLIYEKECHGVEDCEFDEEEYDKMIYWYEKNNDNDEMWMKCNICHKYSPYYIKEKKDEYEFVFIDMLNYGPTASLVDLDRPHYLDNCDKDVERQEERERLKNNKEAGYYND